MMEQLMTSHVLSLCNRLVDNLVLVWMHLPMLLLVAMFEDGSLFNWDIHCAHHTTPKSSSLEV